MSGAGAPDHQDLIEETQQFVSVSLQEDAAIEPAIAALGDAVERNPANFAVMFVFGFYLKWSGAIGGGVEMLRRASELRPSDPRPYYWMADAFWMAALAGNLDQDSARWAMELILSDEKLRDAAPESFVQAAEEAAHMPSGLEEYQRWILPRCREQLGVEGSTAAKTAMSLFAAALDCPLDPEDEEHVRQRLSTVRAYAVSKGWDR